MIVTVERDNPDAKHVIMVQVHALPFVRIVNGLPRGEALAVADNLSDIFRTIPGGTCIIRIREEIK